MLTSNDEVGGGWFLSSLLWTVHVVDVVVVVGEL